MRWRGIAWRAALAALVVAWVVGTCFILWAASTAPGACAIPFRTWAATWPLWFILPEAALLQLMRLAFWLCEYSPQFPFQP